MFGQGINLFIPCVNTSQGFEMENHDFSKAARGHHREVQDLVPIREGDMSCVDCNFPASL